MTDSLVQRASEYQNNKRRYDMTTESFYRRIQTGHDNLSKLTQNIKIPVKKPVEMFQFN